MAHRQLLFEHDLDLSPAIVWDALVDPVLVGGWLGEARIEPVVGGDYALSWLGSPAFPPVDGVIEAIDEPRLLTVRSTAHGRFAFRLAPHDGGTRGTWTKLHLEVDLEIDAAFEGRVRRNWTTTLDQLEQLLTGHPVDWNEHETHPQSAAPSRDLGLT